MAGPEVEAVTAYAVCSAVAVHAGFGVVVGARDGEGGGHDRVAGKLAREPRDGGSVRGFVVAEVVRGDAPALASVSARDDFAVGRLGLVPVVVGDVAGVPGEVDAFAVVVGGAVAHGVLQS